MNTPPVPALNQVLLQVLPGVNPANASGSTPNQLATIAAGTLITGNVYGRDATGHTQLETPDGMISLKMDLFIKRGIEVVLKMEQVQKEMFARIVSVDGKSLAKYMESIGMSAPQQDSIAHSSPLLQTPDESTSTNQTVASTTAAPKDVATTLKAILVSPPFLEGDAATPLPPGNVPAPLLPQELDLLPAEIKLILLKAAIGTALKIDVVKLELPQQMQAALPFFSQPNPSTFPTGAPAATSSAGTLNPLPGSMSNPPIINSAVPPNTSAPVPLASGIAIPASIPLPGNAASPLPPMPANPTLPSVSGAAPVPTQIAPAGVAHILNQTGALVESLPEMVVPAQQIVRPLTPSPLSVPETQIPLSVNSIPQEARSGTSGAQASLPNAEPSFLPPAYKPYSPNTAAPLPAQAPHIFTPPPQSATSTTMVMPAQHAASSSIPAHIALTHSPVFSATVIASSPDGQITLQTPVGTLNLFSPTQLPVGTKLSFTIATIEPAPESEITAPPVQGAKPYKGIGEIDDFPYPIPYASNDIATPRLVPRPGASLSAEILFLLVALKGGDVRKWLGEPNAKELEKTGKLDLLQRITQDFAAMRGTLGEARDPGTWMQASIPIFHQGLHTLQWFQKRGDQQGKDKHKSSFDEHFLVDFHLTQLGHMQLDGMVKRQNPGYSFDLTVRSENPLTPVMLRDIQSIYAEAQQIGGFKGALVFRAGLGACVKLDTFQTQADSTTPPHSILA
ncbi:MAG: hypothetical protein U1E36_07460 [Rickettsiales bacterium]